MKEKTIYICKNCGSRSAKWMGVCPRCRQYNTFEAVQEMAQPAAGKAAQSRLADGVLLPLRAVETNRSDRLLTGIGEFNRVLGGGLAPSS